ncbi:hypothetical protein UA08_09394 [Talaromyces atroroseus]|uniref:C2H2-type domain-containing protein n=1 Tax=Talaromyces atroroseus TaxID=1441469 RepID=A0A1Q5Q641_TALAT|nr:hypothetical protein UA08_09394 [Talaromyces atroroseus]OKL55317.1 hypothetical protein UA08_09394 [Talaromyces atroroseus]
MYDIDRIRRREYPDLDKTCYLDYGGATPYAKSLVNLSAKLWKSGLYGNPHSNSSSSLRATEHVDRARQNVLEFFRADAEYFDVVFVANATAAIKLVAYSFQEKGFWYGYHTDAHTSLVGIRELADIGYHCFGSDKELGEWIGSSKSQEDGISYLPVDRDNTHGGIADKGIIKLVGYPAQSNMTGHRTPKQWAKQMRQRNHSNHGRLYTLLDAAAYCSSAQLDLSDPDAAPDFTSVSFYKIFGMPDLGALIVRKESSAILTSRRYFGGGTVDMVLAFDHFHAKKYQNTHEILEDGTVPFHSLVMLNTGIILHKRLFHSMDEISEHASQLAQILYTDLSRLRHANGRPACKIYKDENSIYGDGVTQGPTVAFNICMSNGAWVQHDHFETLASACNIQIRTGGVCNPGGIAGHLNLASWEMRRNYCEGFRCGQPFKVRGGKPTGVIRASLGGMSNKKDVETFVAFIQQFFVDDRYQQHSSSVVGKTLRKRQRTWTMKYLRVFPIRSCPAWVLPTSQAWELDHCRFAMDGEWCLVNLETDKVLEDRTATNDLAVHINIELGRLCLETSKCEPRCTFDVDLWELPTGDWVLDSLEETEQGTYRMARKFVSKDLDDFLTLALGQPTTLARLYDFIEELPISTSPERASARAAPSGIFIQFSGDAPEEDVHILLNRTQPNTDLNEKYPPMLQIGNQTLVHSSWGNHRDYKGIHKRNVANYYRLSDVEENITSQNTVVHLSDPVVELRSTSTSEGEADSRDYHFCPVANCREKYVDYSMFRQHLTSHARFFVRPRRSRCWFR